MILRPSLISRLVPTIVLVVLFEVAALGRPLDDFDDNTKVGWKDYTFQTGFGIPREAGGRFVFEQPPAGQAIFSASQKVSEEFELRLGRSVEFRVDLVNGGAKDSFAILSFTPVTESPLSLTGYGIAKSTTDILVTKGIGKYFYNRNPPEPIRNDGVTLVLNLTGVAGGVRIHARVIDTANPATILWESTFLDTSASEVMANGSDNPPAPFLGRGYFTLFLYQDFDNAAPENPYTAVFDNAEVFVTEESVVDDFNDATKTGWKDFSVAGQIGFPAEKDGAFVIEQPPAGQPIFSGSQKISRELELAEGERLELRVDLEQGGGKDSFAILAFTPKSESPLTLGGYGLAKSTTDILLTKGINRYFYNENVSPAVKQDNTTLSLSLMARNGSVIIEGRVFDREDGGRVIFDQIVVDSPAADVLRNGTDSPAAPFIQRGTISLYLYQDFDDAIPENPYRAIFDQLTVWAPPAATNTPPIITDVSPLDSAAFLPGSTQVTFKVIDDQPVVEERVSVELNGVLRTKTNGLVISGTGLSRSVSLAGLAASSIYRAVIRASDANGGTNETAIHFDTFPVASLVIEAEDYNFDGGQYIQSPVPIAEGGGPQADAYSQRSGMEGIDYHDTRTVPRAQDAPWRPNDSIRMTRSLDGVRKKYLDAGGTDAGIHDYTVGDHDVGEWQNYTRRFPQGNYQVYLRQSLVNLTTADCILERVTGDRTKPDATTTVLGTFLGSKTGFGSRNFLLTDGSGLNPVTIRLDGETTLRLRHVTPDRGDANRQVNHLTFIPVAASGVQRPAVVSLKPGPGTVVDSVAPDIDIVIENRDTRVDASSVRLKINGNPVGALIAASDTGVALRYFLNPIPAPGSEVTANLEYQDNTGEVLVTNWKFQVNYILIPVALRAEGAGGDPGFKVRVVQPPPGGGVLENSLARAEEQLRNGSTIPREVQVSVTLPMLNLNKIEGGAGGAFGNDQPVPGISIDSNGVDFALEALTFLQLRAGVVRLGIQSDDGFKFSLGHEAEGKVLAFANGGPGTGNLEFIVAEAGLYPFRFIWYERAGAAFAELYSRDVTGAPQALLGDVATRGIPAFATVTAPTIVLEAADSLGSEWKSAVDAMAGVNQFRIPSVNSTRFYRVRGIRQPLKWARDGRDLLISWTP